MSSARRRAFVLLAAAWVSACGGMTNEEKLDGQSHWLTQCDSDATCGPAACLCGVCTSECESDSDCWVRGSALTSRCAEAESVGCDAAPRVCVPDCAGDDCISSTSSESTASSRLVFDDTNVPRCPEVAETESLPLATVQSDFEHYEGSVTVGSSEPTTFGTAFTLVFDELEGGEVTLHLNGSDGIVTLGSSYQAIVEAGGSGNTEYAFLALRDDEGTLVIAVNSGGDALYQEGWFNTPELVGATLEVRMICRSAVEGGCFENQVQADYEGTFSADDTVTTAGKAWETLSIGERPYSVHFTGSSVDGGEPLCDGLTPGRYIHFAVVAE